MGVEEKVNVLQMEVLAEQAADLHLASQIIIA
jgi:hypothetical protein